MEAITDIQRKQLQDEGYLLLKQILTNSEVDKLVSRLEELWTEEGDLAGAELVTEPGARRLANLANKGERLFRILCETVQKFWGVLEILCQFFNVQHNAVRRIDNDRQIRF